MKILYLPNQYSQQRQREKKRWIYPVLLAMQAQHYRNLGHEVYWDSKVELPGSPGDRVIKEPEQINFENLPAPDRIFTKAMDPKYQRNGNFKHKPGTYIQVADGCWHGKCTFCVEKNNQWRVRPVWDVHQEIVKIHSLGFKEVFDDSGTFPVGPWLDEFLGMENPGVVFGCNMRMVDAPWRKMKKWGFRMVLFGLESGSQKTLDRIHKGIRVQDVMHIAHAADAGLDPHVAVMFGYPWETDKDALETLRIVHFLLKRGVVKTAQASFYTPPSGQANEGHRKYVNQIYQVALSPQFWINKIKSIKTGDDLKYFFRQIREGIFRG